MVGIEQCNDSKITVALVDNEKDRLDAMPKYFGKFMLIAESQIYRTMELLCEDYRGGYWTFYTTSNGGFFMAPKVSDSQKIELVSLGFCSTVFVSPIAAGLAATMFALSQLSFRYEDGPFADLFHKLREYAIQHDESCEIMRILD